MSGALNLRAHYRLPQDLAELPAKTAVLLAFSGGADSMCLLHLLAEDAKRYHFPLILAHVNHGIRGEEALRDRAFCLHTAKEYGLPIHVLDADVPALAKAHGTGMEEEARRVRYDYFASLMQKEQIPLLVSAHHADDQLETVLFRLARGCTLSGLCGILPVRRFGEGFLVRPLLEAPRAEILQYVKEQGLSYVEDSTNADLSYARNRIRHEVVPVLDGLFPNLSERAALLSTSLREDSDCLSAMAEEFLQAQATEAILSVEALSGLHPALAKRVLAAWIEERLGMQISGAQLLSLWELIRNGAGRAEVTLFGETFVRVEQGRVSLHTAREEAALSYEFPVQLGKSRVPHSDSCILVKKQGQNTKIHNLSTANTINFAIPSAIMKDVFWRSRREGDVILQGGMHRKLRKLYNAKKIPLSLRERLPLLCDGEGILWAPFIGVRDGVKVQEGEELLEIQLLLPTDASELT